MKNFQTYTKVVLLIATFFAISGLNLFSQEKREMNVESPLKMRTEKRISDASKNYCIPMSDCSAFQIEAFELGNINNMWSDCSFDGYGDFTDQSTQLNPGTWYEIFYIAPADDHYFSVWIDFDDDTVFDSDELVIDDFYQATDNEATIPFFLSEDAPSGNHRLRARINGYTSASDPCEDFEFGETEDYMVALVGEGEYCIPVMDCNWGDGLTSFALADIENYNSGCSENGYGDFTTLSTSLNAGETYTLFAETNYDGNYLCIWIDLDDDSEFDEEEMLVDDFNLELGAQIYEIPLTLPADANTGTHRLRAKAVWDGLDYGPCDNADYGETEDYMVEIIGNVPVVDVGIVSIDIPEVIFPGPVPVIITLQNFGTETFTQQVSIINGVDFGTSTIVDDILPGEIRQINYGMWQAQLGTYNFYAYSSYQDDNPDNDDLLKEVVVQIPDVDPPQNLMAQVEENTVLLFWDALETKSVLGYRVYNNGIRVSDTITENSFIDLCLTTGNYSYTVTAIYEMGESLPCLPVEVTMGYCELPERVENFEAYNAGQQLVVQAENMGIDYWHCWSQPAGSDEDPFVSDEVVFEGDNALKIDGVNDAIIQLGEKTEGKYSVAFNLFVPSGFDGFFGIWKDFSTLSPGMDVYFNEDETGMVLITNSEWQPFAYSANTWINIAAMIDLDNDWAKLFLNGTMICQAQWSLSQSGEPGPLKLDIIDFYAGVLWGGEPKSFVDNIQFHRIIGQALPPENVQAAITGNLVTLTWEAPVEGLIEYEVYRDGNMLNSTFELSLTDENLEPGEYEYTLKALYGICESPATNPVAVTIFPYRIYNIPAGWSGLSSSIIPMNPVLDSVFCDVLQDLIIVQNETGMYWPGENVNTLVQWNSLSGYKIKLSQNITLMMSGSELIDKTIQLTEGWNMIPVLSDSDVDVAILFLGKDVLMVKEIAGRKIFWPQYNIQSLEFLQTGKAYFVLMGSDGEIEFP